MKKWIGLYLVGLVISFSGCTKNELHPVPYYQFDININLNLPTYQSLVGVGGWAYIQGAGSKGIVVYRRSVAEFVAFDRHSPADPENTCPEPLATDEENFLILNDTCSEARFSLFDGSIIEGDVDWGLRAYMTSYGGGDFLRIYNP